MQLNTIIVIVSVLLILGFILYRLTKKNTNIAKDVSKEKKEENEENEEVDLASIPENLLETYEIAINPTSLGKPVLYALITCQHCIRTQKFLKENKVDFKVIHVDLFEGNVRKSIMKVVKTFNERGSFPTFITPSGTTVVGYREQLLREALKNESE